MGKQEIVPGIYIPYDDIGRHIEVVAVAKNIEGSEPVVICRQPSGSENYFVQSLTRFTDEIILSDGQKVPRYNFSCSTKGWRILTMDEIEE